MFHRSRVVRHQRIGPHSYFLTLCALGRLPLFVDDDIVCATLEQFFCTGAEEAFAVLTYCLMPDQAHFVVEGTTARSDLHRYVTLAKARSTASYLRSRQDLVGGLWEEGYFERELKNRDVVKAVAKHVLQRPVRAGLASTPLAYPYLGSSVWDLSDLSEKGQG